MTKDPITVVATFKIRRGAEDAFERAIHEHMPNCVAEPGMVRFWVLRDPSDPTRFMFYEDWDDRAAFEQSMRAAWRGPYMEATEHLWDLPRVVDIWKRVPTAWEPRTDGAAVPQ